MVGNLPTARDVLRDLQQRVNRAMNQGTEAEALVLNDIAIDAMAVRRHLVIEAADAHLERNAYAARFVYERMEGGEPRGRAEDALRTDEAYLDLVRKVAYAEADRALADTLIEVAVQRAGILAKPPTADVALEAAETEVV